MAEPLSLEGKRFGLLLVLERLRRPKRSSLWRCLCECGRESLVPTGNLRSGNSRSCGCAAIAATRVRNVRHGYTRNYRHSPEYQAWSHMINRCHNERDSSFDRYGGRGIRVFDDWRCAGGFMRFVDHIGPRPDGLHSLDRIDNSRGYEPGNVRWATLAEQSRNRRSNHWIEYNGERRVVSDWADRLGLRAHTIYHRIRRGITDPARLLAPSAGKKAA